jgi:hypothetical protein
MRHLYEQGGSLTAMDGSVQPLASKVVVPSSLPADFAALARLASALGAPVPDDVRGIREALVSIVPALASVPRAKGLAVV